MTINKLIINKILVGVGAATITGFVIDKIKIRRKKRDESNFKKGYIAGYSDATSTACEWFAEYQKENHKKNK